MIVAFCSLELHFIEKNQYIMYVRWLKVKR
jgi:hypothetical protein